jgi:hypothetical protein
LTTVAVLGTFETAAENSEIVARHIEAAGSQAIRIHRDEPWLSKIKKMGQAQVVVGTGFGFADKMWAAARALGKRTVNYWVGTDVLTAITDRAMQAKVLRATKFINTNLADAPWLAEELKTIGISARMIPLPSPVGFDLRSTPGEPGVLAYLPNERADFYGAPVVHALARRLPELPFAVVSGTADRQPGIRNVKYLGWIKDMQPLYERYPILVRVTRHDGLPKMVREALAYGNQIVFRYAFPGCHHATDEDEAFAALQSILGEGCPINVAGAQYLRELYGRDRSIRDMLEAIGVRPV